MRWCGEEEEKLFLEPAPVIISFLPAGSLLLPSALGSPVFQEQRHLSLPLLGLELPSGSLQVGQPHSI